MGMGAEEFGTNPRDINNSGQIIGWFDDANTGTVRGFCPRSSATERTTQRETAIRPSRQRSGRRNPVEIGSGGVQPFCHRNSLGYGDLLQRRWQSFCD